MKFSLASTTLITSLCYCQARELSLYRIDEAATDLTAVETLKRRAVDVAQAAVIGDSVSYVQPTPVSDVQRETYRSEEARLKKERREMFFRNLGVGARIGSTSMSLSLSLSFNADATGTFGSTGQAVQSQESDDGIPANDDPNTASSASDGEISVSSQGGDEGGTSLLEIAKQKLLGISIDIPTLRAKALSYAKDQRERSSTITNVEEDELRTKALVYAAEYKNSAETTPEVVLVRRRKAQEIP